MTETQIAQLSAKCEAAVAELQVGRQKLESKCEALLILSRELAECRSERDQFKLMAEQLRERYQVLKRQIAGHRPMSPSHDSSSSSSVDLKQYASSQGQGLAKVLMEYREQNKSLQFEVDDLKQKLHDAQGDIKLLREQIVRSRVGTTDEGMTTRHFPAYEREDLVKQLEAAREQTVQLERDLQQVIDEKQELVTERDAYRHKYGRLNTELNYILKGDEKGVVDIDALIMENKYLQERLKQMEEEKSMAMETVSKYKNILEKKKNKGILKVGQSRSGGIVITQKQVHQMIQSRSNTAPSPQAMSDLQALCSALLDSVNDKSLALSHQRKANKILGNRVSELEKKLKTLEVAGLWSVSGNMSSLEKLRQECSEVKMLVPSQTSESSEASDQARETLSDLDSDSLPQTPSVGNSPSHGAQSGIGIVSTDMESDLDLLPTKEEVVKHICGGDMLLGQLSLGTSIDEEDDFSRSKSDVDEDDSQQSEHSHLLQTDEDQETEMKLRNFMDSVTSKILERSHSSSVGASCEQSVQGKHEDRSIRVAMGGNSPASVSGSMTASPSKQPLLREMSEPAQERGLDEKSIEC